MVAQRISSQDSFHTVSTLLSPILLDTFHQFIVEDDLEFQFMLSERFNNDHIRQELSASLEIPDHLKHLKADRKGNEDNVEEMSVVIILSPLLVLIICFC